MKHDQFKGIVEEIEAKQAALFENNWNSDAHVELTLTIAECRYLVNLHERLTRKKKSKLYAVTF